MVGDLEDGAECGYFKLATVIDFQIIAFSDKKRKQKNISIIVPCPEFYGKDFFKEDKVYTITIAIEKNRKRAADFDYIIQNKSALEKYTNENNYWAVAITRE